MGIARCLRIWLPERKPLGDNARRIGRTPLGQIQPTEHDWKRGRHRIDTHFLGALRGAREIRMRALPIAEQIIRIGAIHQQQRHHDRGMQAWGKFAGEVEGLARRGEWADQQMAVRNIVERQHTCLQAIGCLRETHDLL